MNSRFVLDLSDVPGIINNLERLLHLLFLNPFHSQNQNLQQCVLVQVPSMRRISFRSFISFFLVVFRHMDSNSLIRIQPYFSWVFAFCGYNVQTMSSEMAVIESSRANKLYLTRIAYGKEKRISCTYTCSIQSNEI